VLRNLFGKHFDVSSTLAMAGKCFVVLPGFFG
jgi:hypothetical protein